MVFSASWKKEGQSRAWLALPVQGRAVRCSGSVVCEEAQAIQRNKEPGCVPANFIWMLIFLSQNSTPLIAFSSIRRIKLLLCRLYRSNAGLDVAQGV